MKAIEECYRAYAESREADGSKLATALAIADECMVRKEFQTMETDIKSYCQDVEREAFAAGFRFATRLWAEGLRE